MDEGLRRRNTGADGFDDKERISYDDKSKIALPVLGGEITNGVSSLNVPKFETEDVLTSADSLYSSTCSSGDFYECSSSNNAYYKAKLSKIQAALNEPIDRELLRCLARSEGGLLNDAIRRKVWPELLDMNVEGSIVSASDDIIEKHMEYHQVVLDVSRSLKRFPPGITDFERKILQEQLLKLILSVIIKHPYLSYYQGYHDVAVTLLLVVGDEKDNTISVDEDETEGFGESVSSLSGDFGVNNDLKMLRDQMLNMEQPSSKASITEGKGGGVANVIDVTEKKTVEDSVKNVNVVKLTRRRSTDENLPPEDGRGEEIVDINMYSSATVEELYPVNNMRGKTNASTESADEENDTSRLTLNGLKNKVDSGDEDESNFGETSDQDSTISEKENLDSASSGRLISMWCNIVALKMLEHVSLNHFRACMERTMDATCHLLHHVFPIVGREDITLCNFLDKSGVGTMFCLPWVLTWFSHNVNNHDIVVRLYDYFLASPVASPLYIAAAIILHRKNDIFQTECEMPALHGLLSKIPDDLPFEQVLIKASALYEAYPPESLKKDVEERLNRDLKQLEQKRKEIAMRPSPVNHDVALVPWRLLALLPPGYAERLVPWFIIPGRMWWWTRLIPARHLRSRYVLAAIPIAMYYAYSHLLNQ
ncbi:uncharacterized protein [Hetaerina americana]|uniref:uncharacterized protein n=1 Tax=Hetaerina americana TaxID=62018 RepID=UPI003A7F4922